MATETSAAITAIRDLTIYRLARMAGCADPDSRESAGGRFLESVRDSVVEQAESNPERTINDWSDDLAEIADWGLEPTKLRWAEFVDLAAYQEEPEAGEWPDDLTEAAGAALYQIAYRLAAALVELLDGEEDDEDPGAPAMPEGREKGPGGWPIIG